MALDTCSKQGILDDSFHQPTVLSSVLGRKQLLRNLCNSRRHARTEWTRFRASTKRLPVPIPGWKYPFPFRTRQSSSLGR